MRIRKVKKRSLTNGTISIVNVLESYLRKIVNKKYMTYEQYADDRCCGLLLATIEFIAYVKYFKI